MTFLYLCIYEDMYFFLLIIICMLHHATLLNVLSDFAMPEK